MASGAPAALITLNTPAPDAPVPAPRYEVDPVGQAAGVAVDRQDHVWVLQRPRTRAPAPPVMELDGDGNLVQAWGGPGPAYTWPASEHGIYVVEAEVEALGRLMTRYAEVPMSLADACLVRMVERHPGAAVLTIDRDFRVYRAHGRRVIPAVMPSDL